MRPAGRIGRVIVVASLLAVSAALLLPTFTGRPVVSYASSGSMEPTIGVFDVFFVQPYPSDLAVGDIIVFESVIRGGPAVHRIVGGDPGGWLTQGDANERVDQDLGEPLVTPERLRGKVLTRGDGSPFLLPHVGIAYAEANVELVRAQQMAGGSRGLASLAFLALAIVLGAASFATRGLRRPTPLMSPRRRALLRRLFPRGILGRHVAIALLLVLLMATSWGAAHARSDVELTMVVVRDPGAADDVRAAAPGGSLARVIEVRALGLLPTYAFLEAGSERLEVPDAGARIGAGGVARFEAREHAGAQSGLQSDTLHVWRYPALLPLAPTQALHDAAPGAPYLLLGGALGLAGALWFAALRIGRLPVGRMLGVQEDWL